jgi:hypothetical protein
VDEGGGRKEEKSGRSVLPPAAPRLLDALRERLRYMHDSIRTEEAYVYWVRGFVRWAGGRRHPREMGPTEVQAFLSMLANERRVAAATHRQALSALLFLYREVLGFDMPWLQQLGRPPTDEHDLGPGIEAREPLFPCYRVTPSSTARATSAS